MSAPVTDPIEDLLAAALADARTDDRWAIAPKAQAVTSVRRAAFRQRTRNAGLALAGVAGATVALGALGGGSPTQTVVQQPASEGSASPTPAPGISPEWIPQSGADWLLDKDAYDAFVASHTLPSDKPATVQSPAPLTEVSKKLQQDVAEALPNAASLLRQDAPDGHAGAAAIHAELADGTPVEIRRERLQYPISTQFGGDMPQRPVTRRTLPSGSVLMTIAHTGYGWGEGIPEGANTVIVITREGVETAWNAPLSVPLDTVARWAEAADRG